jgi:hypothetical protein
MRPVPGRGRIRNRRREDTVDEPITVERVRYALVVGRPEVDRDAVALAEALSPERYRTAVVVGRSAVAAVARLDPWVVADLAEATRGGLRVVAPNLGAIGPDGQLPPARLLADRLGVEIVAPDGTPVALCDGSVFVPGRDAGWVSYRPGAPRNRFGPRHPAPWWQAMLPDTLAEHVTQIPLGVWVRRPDAPARPDDPLGRQAADRDRMFVVLGAPGETPPTAAAVADLLRALPDEARDRAVLASYGVTGLAQAVADELGTPVRVSHGMPGPGRPTHVDGTGTITWRPFAVESVYRPGGAAVLDRWVAPAPRMALAEPASYRVADGWRVDVLARGLLVRPETLRPDPAWSTETGPTADLVLAAADPVPDPVLSAIDELVRELPADARDRLRIAPVTQPAAAAATRLAAADRVVPLVTPLSNLQAVAASTPTAAAVPTAASVPTAAAVPAIAPATTPPTAIPPVMPSVSPSVMPPAAPPVMPAGPSVSEGQVASVAALLPERKQLAAPAPPQSAPPQSAAPQSAVTAPPRPAIAAPPQPVVPVPVVASAAPPAVPAVEVPPDVRSTAEQRRGMRGKLGSRYDVATRAVTRVLSERPGLRAGVADHAALLTELAVVRVFAEAPMANYDTDFHTCLACGLRRLPTARAVVVRGIPADTKVRTGTVLRLPAPILAAPAVPGHPVGQAEALIWTTTARKLEGLLDDGVADVVLCGHTRLRVLAVETGPVRRILLSEEGTPDDAALTRLRAAAAARTTVGGSNDHQATRWFGALPAA